jgi:steroid delta-isomerase-like uncharacterized protein
MPTFDFRAYANAWNTHSVDRILEFYEENVELVDPNTGRAMHGTEPLRSAIDALLRAFPDVNGDLEYAVQSGNELATLFHITGTNEGDYRPPPPQRGYARTGRRVSYALASFFTLNDEGRICRQMDVMDMAGFMAQLGIAAPQRPQPQP